MGLYRDQQDEEKARRKKERKWEKASERRKRNGEALPLEPPFLGLEFKQLESAPWKKLSAQAARLYLYMWMKSYRTPGGVFSFTYHEAKEKYCVKHGSTFKTALIELSEYGFIEVVKLGGYRSASLYRLSKKWKDLILPAQIQKVEEQTKARKKDRVLLAGKQLEKEEKENSIPGANAEGSSGSADSSYLDELLEKLDKGDINEKK